jgi:RNA-binding protein YlmH
MGNGIGRLRRGRCVVVCAGGRGTKEREAYLKGVAKSEMEAVSRVLEQSISVGERWDKIYTDFLSPPEAAAVQMVLERLQDVTAVSYGGE